MHGSMRVIKPGELTGTTTELDRPPELDVLQHAVGGYIELVPNFGKITNDKGELVECYVFCNENGKLLHLPINRVATELWRVAQRAEGLPVIHDLLVGPVVVLTGDQKFVDAMVER